MTEILKKYVVFLGDLKTPKGPFEINGPFLKVEFSARYTKTHLLPSKSLPFRSKTIYKKWELGRSGTFHQLKINFVFRRQPVEFFISKKKFVKCKQVF